MVDLLLFGVSDRKFKHLLAMDEYKTVSTDMALDPGGELIDPGVDPRQVWSTTARPPADNANQEPATSSWCLTGQRTP